MIKSLDPAAGVGFPSEAHPQGHLRRSGLLAIASSVYDRPESATSRSLISQILHLPMNR